MSATMTGRPPLDAAEPVPTPPPSRRGSTVRTAGQVALHAVLAVLAVAVLVPFGWMLVSSVKLDTEVFTVPINWIPDEFHWDNFTRIWSRIPLGTYLGNSLFLS